VVDVVGRGAVLAGRYRILQPLPSDLVGSTSWQAIDQILDRPVHVRILVEGNIPQALDSARRAALVSDARLVRVLDVGSHQGISFVVTEQVVGPSLAELLTHGPLTADQARAIVGETAAALEVARRRGVHHLALRPSVLHITPDDRVILTGLAFDGALLGQGLSLGDARTTTRADTIGLVRLLYAALTGRWPAGDDDVVSASGPGSVPVAPTADGGPVPPSALVADVPADLDTLCAVTLGPYEDGPHTPAELVRELEPWGEIRTAAPNERGGSAPTGDAAAAPAIGLAPGLVQRQSVRSTFEETSPAGANLPGTPPPAQPRATFPPVAGGTPQPGAAPGQARRAPLPPPVRTSVAPPQAPLHAEPPAPTRTFAPSFPPGPPPSVPTRVPTTRPGAGAPGPRADQPTGFGLPFEGASRAPASEPIAERRFDPTKLVLALVVVAVVIGVIIAVNSLFRPVSGPTEAKPAPVPANSSSPAASPSASASAGKPTPSTSAVPSGAAPVIASATTIDPSDNNGEHEELAARAIDGDPATTWYTQIYKSPDFSGIKPAVGFVLTLSAPATVSTVTLHVNGTGGNVEVRSTNAASPTTGPILASGALSPNTVLKLTAPTQTTSIVLWFTSLAQTPDGSNRIEISEITLS